MPVVQRSTRRFIQRQPWRRVMGGVAPLALVLLLLAACGVTTTSDQQPGGASTGTSMVTTATTSAVTPGGTPVSSLPPTDAVTLSSDSRSYTPSSTITVTLTNHRSTSIFTFDHQTSCTIIALQQQTDTGWKIAGECLLGSATRLVEIKAGETMKIALAPSTGTIRATPWPAGTYRAALQYALSGQDMGAGTVAATPTFTIS
jgi:hypothetical protein